MTDATIGYPSATSPSRMVLYGHDGQPIGHLYDYGPGCVLAYHLTERGEVSLGFHRDRRAAREAIEARHRGEPPRAA
jgi:hypothetical protein